MDPTAGLTLVAQALGIVKELREMDKNYDAALLKAQMADLYSTLADVKIALSDARDEIHERDRQIRSLKDQMETLKSGEACIICGQGKMKVIDSKPHPAFFDFGVQERTLECDQCGHRESRNFDPAKDKG